MIYMSAVVQARQHAKQSDTPDRSPADKLDLPIRRVCMRRNEHRPASVFAVVECKKQTAASIPFCFIITAQHKSAALQLSYTNKYAKQIPDVAERLEDAIGDGSNIGRKTEAQNIERINFAGSVREPNQIHWPGAPGDKRIERRLGAFIAKIAQKGIPGAQRQKTQSDALRVR